MLDPTRTDAAPAPDAGLAQARAAPVSAPAGRALTVGDGRYVLLAPLGEGGTATVYRAMDRVLGVERAVKVLSAELVPGDDLRRRLVAEARVMSHLEHRHVLPIYDVGSDDGRAYVVMALATSGSLYDRLNRDGPLSPAYAVARMLEVLDALAAAHHASIVHRDVKPANILLGPDGDALLADFGIALLATEDVARHTRNDVAMGSFSYMPPEQRIDARSVGPTADLYAAGATLYALVTNMSPVDLFLAEPTSPRWSPVPLPLRAILVRATRMAPTERYATAGEFSEALRTVLPELVGLVGLVGLDPMTRSRETRSLIVPSPVTASPEEPRGTVLTWVTIAGLAALTAAAMVVWTRPVALPPIGGHVLAAAPTLSFVEPSPAVPAPIVAPAPGVSVTRPSAIGVAPPPLAHAALTSARPSAAATSSAAPSSIAAPSTASPPSGAEGWSGSFGGRNVALTLSGPDAALTGTAELRHGGLRDVTAVSGTRDTTTGALRLEHRDSDGDEVIGVYSLTVGDDGARLQGQYVRTDGTQRVTVQLRRLP
jgi:tRNA A-37 threonylcarbamoyl transferase component Bud32